MESLKYIYDDANQKRIMECKNNIELKEFFWQAEDEFEKYKGSNYKRMYLLTSGAYEMEMRASTDFNKYVDIFKFKFNFSNNDPWVDFHGWLIAKINISLIDCKRIIAN